MSCCPLWLKEFIFPGEEVQKRIIAVAAVEIEYAVVLIVIVLPVPGAEDVDAEGELVLAAQHVHVVGRLETGDRETAQGAGPAADGEPAVADR